jgi:type VI secretion system secreted protein Hcp
MAIYMSFDGVKGAVTEDSHKEWIEVSSFQWGVGRGIATPTGAAADREASAPSVSEVVVTKPTDVASLKLLNEALAGEGKTVKIDFTTTVKSKTETYMTIELTNAMVSGYSFSSGGDRPNESVSLNFTKVQMSFAGNKEAGAGLDAKGTAGYDLGLAKTL